MSPAKVKAAGNVFCLPKDANLSEFNSAKLSLKPINFFNSVIDNLLATEANSIACFENCGFDGSTSFDRVVLSFFAGDITTSIHISFINYTIII